MSTMIKMAVTSNNDFKLVDIIGKFHKWIKTELDAKVYGFLSLNDICIV